MAVLSQYDYIFGIAVCFAFLEAWNIGANDVANSFATSVSSRCLTMKQAMLVASVAEFSGAVAVGSRVTDTIRSRIVDPNVFAQHPSILLLAMMCSAIGSSIFLTIATRFGLPVSTTHSIVGGIVGAVTASVGIRSVNWTVNGVPQVFLAWISAPGIAGALGAALFLVTKFTVLARRHAVRNALISIPFYAFLTFGSLTMLLAWKGIQVARDATTAEVLIATFCAATGGALIVTFFVLPYLWRRIMKEDWTLRWYMAWQGPWLLNRPPPPPTPPGVDKVQIKDYYRGHLTADELAYVRASETLLSSVQSTPGNNPNFRDDDFSLPPPAAHSPDLPPGGRFSDFDKRFSGELVPQRPPGPWNRPAVMIWRINRIILRGLEKDVISLQKRNAVLSWDLEDMHARSKHYDNRAEHMFSTLQVMTAATASFVHGANDVSNSVAPLSTAYSIWQSGKIEAQVGVPIWILCLGGAGIVIGLLTYGYHVMRNLGNRLTLISPSRGFCMELSTAMTVLMATRLSIPVSTTQCITGATVGVGLANGDWRCINWKLVAWIYFGWVITLPVTGFISGSIMGIIINAPRFESGI